MGSIEVKNLLLSTQLKQSGMRLLIVDDNQIRYNHIISLLEKREYKVEAVLLDDQVSLEKQLHLDWDLILFGRAYELTLTHFLRLLADSDKAFTPTLYLAPEALEMSEVKLISMGIYDVLNIDQPEQCLLKIIRALAFSRLQKNQMQLTDELKHNVQIKQNWIEEHKKAVAIIEEGIVVECNHEFTHLFGFNTFDDVIGSLLIDLIQPEDIQSFKARFKKLAFGKFEYGPFELISLNPQLTHQNPVQIECNPTDQNQIIEITISTHFQQDDQPFSPQLETAPHQDSRIAPHTTLAKILQHLEEHPAQENALVIFSLASCPDYILSSDWDTFKGYFGKLSDFILEQTNGAVFKIETALYATIIQAETIKVLKSRLSALHALEKPRLVNLGDQTYQQHVKIGYSLFKLSDLNVVNFEQLIANAYNTPLPNLLSNDAALETTLEEIEEIHFEVTQADEPTSIQLNTPSSEVEPDHSTEFVFQAIEEPVQSDEVHGDILVHLRKVLERDQITLKFQQIYDKEDTSLNTYEVSSGFIFENQWIQLDDIEELVDDPELSIKIDRWILVEAAKQLHNFLTQYPEAKLIINLRHHVLLKHHQLAELISKLLMIVGAKAPQPLILQFKEKYIAQHLNEILPAIEVLRAQGADIAVCEFGLSKCSDLILKVANIQNFTLHEEFTDDLNTEEGIERFKQAIEYFNSHRSVNLLLKNLNDMNSFANAWNVDVRFLQGDYYQRKLDQLMNVQDQS